MHILLIYAGGRHEQALLLEATRERMRVMLPGRGDAVEFRLFDGIWMGESGAKVEIGAVMAWENSMGRGPVCPDVPAYRMHSRAS